MTNMTPENEVTNHEMTLEQRVEAFALMELPGQPRMMHMGTSYLVTDLWREVKLLRAYNERLRVALREICEAADAFDDAEDMAHIARRALLPPPEEP